MGTTTHQLGRCSVQVDHDARSVTTTFADGTTLLALPNEDAESVALARGLGYEGSDAEVVWAMTCEHDLAHMLLAQREGREHSPTLYGVASGEPVDGELAAAEESRVCAFSA